MTLDPVDLVPEIAAVPVGVNPAGDVSIVVAGDVIRPRRGSSEGLGAGVGVLFGMRNGVRSTPAPAEFTASAALTAVRGRATSAHAIPSAIMTRRKPPNADVPWP